MKTKILLLTSAIMMAMTFSVSAQAPEKFNYQGIARDNTGEPLTNQALGVQISILDGATAEYVETHTVTTNGFGLYTIQIGNGAPVTGTMAGVDWSTGNKFIQVGIDPNGGTNYTDLGTTELLSVPYALYAASSPGGGGAPTGPAGGDLTGTYPNPGIANNAVTSGKIDNGAVATADLENDAVTAEKINDMGAAAGEVLKWNGTAWAPSTDVAGGGGGSYTAGDGISITGNVIAADLGSAVQTSEIDNNAINSGKIDNGAVATADLENNSVTSGKIDNGAVATADLANDAVTAAKIDAMGATNGQVLTFDGTDWAPATAASGSAGWELDGNAATTTDFIGTTNDEDLRLMVNNTGAGIITSEYPFNTAFGQYSFQSNTDGNRNTANGSFALQNNTTGSWNTAMGVDALKSNTTGEKNTAMGFGALVSNTTGNYNVATGAGALHDNTTGQMNVANGNDALRANTTGERNTAIGTGALLSNTIGSYNVAAGNDVLVNNTSGEQNTAAGYQALYSNTTGSGNSATGYAALNLNTTGDWNTAAGRFTLSNNTTGNFNTAFGVFGLDSNVTGSRNTSLGYNADVLGNDLTNATAIGADAEVAQDNSLILGSIAGVNSAVASTKVGIGTTTPRAILEVQGNTLQNITVGGLGLENASLLVSDGTITSADAMRSIVTFANGSSYENQGILAVANGEAGNNVGSFSLSTSSGTANNYGVYGSADGGANAYGVYGTAAAGSSSNYAGYFNGDVMIIGNLAKSGGTFKIDNPLDPANKYLNHSFVESPEMMNIYNGNVTTDANGYVTVIMPDYFNALNKDYRYQLTVIGTFAQAIISEKMQGNQFVIRTDKPNVEVSWQVTGVRADKWANANRVKPVTEKEPELRGYYLNPKAYGLPVTKGIGFKTMPLSAQKAIVKNLGPKNK